MNFIQPIDVGQFFKAADALAVQVEMDSLAKWLPRSKRVPHDFAVLMLRGRGERVLLQAHDANPEEPFDQIMIVRLVPLVLSFDDVPVNSLDHHACSAQLTMRVSPVSDGSELEALRRQVMGGSRFARLAQLQAHLASQVQGVLALAAEGRGVEVLMEAQSNAGMAEEIARNLQSAAFACGISIERPVQVRIDSPVYRQMRLETAEAARQRNDLSAKRHLECAALASRQVRTDRMTQLLDELRKQADENPSVKLSDLLQTVPQADRRDLFPTFLAAGDDSAVTKAIVVGSGGELLWYAPDSPEAPANRLLLPDEVGPIRSVQWQRDVSGRQRLLVGASTGVHELAADGSGEIRTYRADRRNDVRGGFNSVTLVGDRLWASHSELGLMQWRRESAGVAVALLADQTRGARAVRGAVFRRGQVYCSIDDNVLRVDVGNVETPPICYCGSRATITSLDAGPRGVFAGNAEGDVLHWRDGNHETPVIMHSGRSRASESVILREMGGLECVFYTDTASTVTARWVDDACTCFYEAGGQTLLRVEVQSDWVVCINELRDRLIMWKPGQPSRPVAIVEVSRLTRRSIQDVCLVPLA